MHTYTEAQIILFLPSGSLCKLATVFCDDRFFATWYKRHPRLILYNFCARPRINYFSKKPQFRLVESDVIVFQDHSLGSRGVCVYPQYKKKKIEFTNPLLYYMSSTLRILVSRIQITKLKYPLITHLLYPTLQSQVILPLSSAKNIFKIFHKLLPIFQLYCIYIVSADRAITYYICFLSVLTYSQFNKQPYI